MADFAGAGSFGNTFAILLVSPSPFREKRAFLTACVSDAFDLLNKLSKAGKLFSWPILAIAEIAANLTPLFLLERSFVRGVNASCALALPSMVTISAATFGLAVTKAAVHGKAPSAIIYF